MHTLLRTSVFLNAKQVLVYQLNWCVCKQYPLLLRLYAWQMPGRLAWILQELPALLGVAYTVIAATTAQRSLLSADSVNVALMGLFVLHYVHRYADTSLHLMRTCLNNTLTARLLVFHAQNIYFPVTAA